MKPINRPANETWLNNLITTQKISSSTVKMYQNEIDYFLQNHFDCDLELNHQCQQHNPGYKINLTYENGCFYEQLAPCAHTLKRHETQHYLNQFVMADFDPLVTKTFLFTKSVADQYRFYSLDETQPENWAFIQPYISSLTEYQQKKKLVQSFVENLQNPGKNSGWYLTGTMGVGKTQLLRFLAVLAASKYDQTVAFVNVNYLINQIKATFNQTEQNANQLLDRLSQVDLLVLDDLGAEQVTSWVRDDLLFNLLNYRMENQKLTYFSSNLSWAQLQKHYNYQPNSYEPNKILKTNRLLERIKTLTTEVTLTGSDHRYA